MWTKHYSDIFCEMRNAEAEDVKKCIINIFTGLSSQVRLWPGEAERGWTPQLPLLQGCVVGSGQIHSNMLQRCVAVTLLSVYESHVWVDLDSTATILRIASTAGILV